MFSSDTQNKISNSFQKSKKSTQQKSSLKTIRDQIENSIIRRRPFRSGRPQEESQKFLSMPDDDSATVKREDRSAPSTNYSSSSNLSSKSKKGKIKKSSFSHHSSKSKIKSKTIENDDQSFNKNKSIFEPSKLLKQPIQQKKYNLDFDSRWEYFLELKALDDATKRIYNSAFFQIWKTLYQKRYLQKVETRASQIESTLDRFNSTHSYNPNSVSLYNTQNGKYNIEQNRQRELPINYSFSSYQDSSEARVEKMQQKYRKQFNNYSNYDNDNNFKQNRSYDTKYIDEFKANYNQSYRYNNQKYNDTYNGNFESSYREYQKMFKNNNNRKTSNINYNRNNLKNEYITTDYFANRKSSNVEYSNENNENEYTSNYGPHNQNQSFNQSYNIKNYNKISLRDEEDLNFDYMRSKSLSLMTSASDSINKTTIANSNEFNAKNEEFIRQSKSYDPSISKELIDEIEGRISDQYDKEVALDFASQLNTIAKFNNTLNDYNQPRRNLNIEEHKVNETKSKIDESYTQKNELQSENEELHKANEENGKLHNQSLSYHNQNSSNNDSYEQNEETDFNELNNSTDFIDTSEQKSQKEKNNYCSNEIQQKQTAEATEKNANFSKNYQNQTSFIDNTNKRNNFDTNQQVQNDSEILTHFDTTYQQKKVTDKYDKYIEQITRPSKPNNNLFFENYEFENDDDDDLEEFIQIQKMKFNSSLNYANNRNKQSTNQQNFNTKISVRNNNNFSIDKLLEEEIKNNEIPVDTALDANIARKASASRIRSVLSKSTIGFNSNENDSDSDQIDLSGVQFYHISQAERAMFTNSNLSGMAKNDIQNNNSNLKSRNSSQQIIMNQNGKIKKAESESEDLTPVARNQNKKDNQKSLNKKEQQDNSRNLNASGSLDQSSPKNTLGVSPSTRRKRSSTLNGISPIIKMNKNYNDQIDDLDQTNKSQQKNGNEQTNGKKQTTNELDQRSQSLKTNNFDQNNKRRKSQQVNGFNQNTKDQHEYEYDKNNRKKQSQQTNKNDQINQASEFDQNNSLLQQASEFGQNSNNKGKQTSEFIDQNNRIKQTQQSNEYIDQNSNNRGKQSSEFNNQNNRIKQTQQSSEYINQNSSNRGKQSSEFNDQNNRIKQTQKSSEYINQNSSNRGKQSSEFNGQNYRMQQTSEYDGQSNLRQQTFDFDQRKQKQQASEYNQSNNQHESIRNQNNRKIVTNEIFENNSTQQSTKIYKNNKSQVSNYPSSGSNSYIRKQQSTQVASNNKLDISSPISLSLKKSKSNITTSEYTEVSKRNLLSREDDASDESEGNVIYQKVSNKKKQNGSFNPSLFDNQDYSYEEDETENNRSQYFRAENYKRHKLASMFDADELQKMEKRAYLCDIFSKPFPDDLYDDIFTTGSDRRNEYLENTKLASIIRFFTTKEFSENTPDDTLQK